MKFFSSHCLLLSSACLLAACGGGSGADTTTATPVSASTTSTATAPTTATASASSATAPKPTASSPTTAPTPTPTPTSTSPSSAAALNAVYKNVKWQTGVSVTFPTDCSMTYTSNGAPNHALDAYYLEPVKDVGGSVVATAPGSRMQLGTATFTASTTKMSFTFNTCPAKASTTTATSGGAIGWMISGASLFNATEGNNTTTPALSDNVSYTFVDSSNVAQKATFIDSCNGHPTPLKGTYHYHGLPECVTSIVDAPAGPSHIIGIANDGFPIYGNKDASGNAITTAQLDACNGITSATPEFPNGIYHYVLPANELGFQSSLKCLSGTVATRLAVAVLANGICYGSRVALVLKGQRQRVAANGRNGLADASVSISL